MNASSLVKLYVDEVRSEATHRWVVSQSYFIEMAKGKEIGHKMADLVDEKTTALLTVNH